MTSVIASTYVSDIALLITAIGGLGTLVAAVGALIGGKVSRSADAAATAADGADHEAGQATQARTAVLVSLVVEAEHRTAAMKRRIITCPVKSCPTRAALMKEDR